MPPDDANAQETIERPDRRESIWSVSERWRWLYFTFFLLLMGGGSALVGWDALFGEDAGLGVVQSMLAAFGAEASVAVASAGMSLGITEVVMLSTLLSRKLDERKARILREGRAAGRTEERVARDAEWDAWLERMLAAQSKGAAFTEPPPSRRASDTNGA